MKRKERIIKTLETIEAHTLNEYKKTNQDQLLIIKCDAYILDVYKTLKANKGILLACEIHQITDMVMLTLKKKCERFEFAVAVLNDEPFIIFSKNEQTLREVIDAILN